jgi:hypothetical protein
MAAVAPDTLAISAFKGAEDGDGLAQLRQFES